MMNVFPRKLKVSKTDSGTVFISKWLSNEELVSLLVTNPDGLVQINDYTFDGGKLSVSFTGISKGVATIHFEYSTATRSDCVNILCAVIDDC